MKIDLAAIMDRLTLENGFILIGGIAMVTSIFVRNEIGLKISMLTLFFGAIVRFYNLSIINGILNTYIVVPKRTNKKAVFDEKKLKTKIIDIPFVPPLRGIAMHVVDFLSCLCFLGAYIYFVSRILPL